MNIQELDRSRIKSSNIKIIKCGNILELYEYETPYFYNHGTLRAVARIKEEDTPTAMRDDNIARAQRKIKRLVNSNSFVYGYHPIFITYTFARNCTDIREANRYFKQHIDELRRKIVGRSLRYLAVPEIQKRGAIHYHVIFFDLPYIVGIKSIFSASWGQGFIQVKAIEHVRNVGAYVSKYFGKQWAKSRILNTKSYFSSCGLYQPETYHNLDILKEFDNIVIEHEQAFVSSKYGIISYTQLKINNNERKNNNLECEKWGLYERQRNAYKVC